MVVGCNSEKKAARLISRAHRINPEVLPKTCGEMYPGVARTDSFVIYKQGDPVVFQDTITQYDTVENVVYQTKYITKQVNTTDTVYKLKTSTIVNRAREQYLSDLLDKAKQLIASLQKENEIMLWALAVLAAYTLLRWVLRIWNIKIP